MRSHISAIATVIVLSILAACGRSGSDIVLVDLELPTPAASLAPNFTRSPGGVVRVSWLETEGDFSRLMVARWQGSEWSAKRVVAEGTDWFVNWADFPSLIALDEKRIVAQWLVRSGAGTYAYDVHVGQSVDGGETWSELGVLHDDRTETEHGFAALYPDMFAGNAAAGVVWLDGRNMQSSSAGNHGGEGEGMSLRSARLDAGGEVVARTELDSLACDCCQTAAVTIGDDVLVAYRDRVLSPKSDGSIQEIRDIMLLRRSGEVWREQGYINADNWEITGCPVNGPAMTVDDERVAIAWFTAAAGRPVVKAGLSKDGGLTFHTFEVSDDSPLGRVDIALLNGMVAVSWLAQSASGAEIRIRTYDHGGRPLMSEQRVLPTTASRASGFPQLIAANDQLLLAWTEVQEGARHDAGQGTGQGTGKDTRQTTRVHVAQLSLKSR